MRKKLIFLCFLSVQIYAIQLSELAKSPRPDQIKGSCMFKNNSGRTLYISTVEKGASLRAQSATKLEKDKTTKIALPFKVSFFQPGGTYRPAVYDPTTADFTVSGPCKGVLTYTDAFIQYAFPNTAGLPEPGLFQE